MPAAGWYPEPDDATRARYWDGSAWVAERVWDGTAWVEVPSVSPPTAADPATGTAGAAPPTEKSDRSKRRAIGAVILVVGLGIVAFAVLGRDRSSDDGYLSGHWSSPDYTCPWGVKRHETLTIRHTGTRLVAIKVKGDNCVPGGHKTFVGHVNGRQGTVRFWAAQPGGTPALGAPTPLRVKDANHFNIEFPGVGQMAFVRDPSGGSGLSLWIVLVALVLIVAALGYGLSRRRRRRAA